MNGNDAANLINYGKVKSDLSQIAQDNLKTKQEVKIPLTKTVLNVGEVLEDCNATTGWTTYTGSAIALDNTNFVIGTGSVNMTSSEAGMREFLKTLAAPITFTEKNIVSFSIFVTQLTGGAIRFQVRDAATKVLYKDVTGLVSGWNKIDINMNDCISSGGATVSDQYDRVRVIILSSSVGDNISFDNLRYRNKRTPKACFCFDDTLASQYTYALPLFKENEIVGSLCVLSDSVGAGLSTAQINEFIDAGWDVINHSKTADSFTTLTTKQLYNNLNACNEYLQNNANTLGRMIVAYPSGAYNAQIITELKRLGYIGARATDDATQNVPLLQQETGYAISSKAFSATYLTNKATVDAVIASGKAAIWYIHGVDANVLDQLTQIIAYIKETGVEVIRLSDIFTTYSKIE